MSCQSILFSFMQTALFLAVANPAPEIAEKFGANGQLLLTHTIGFIVVAVLLKKFAYGPLLTMLDERKKRVAESMENAEKTKKELAAAQAKAQEIITQASVQANKIIEETRAAAAKISEAEAQKAIATANQIIAKAKESNEAELARMKTELRREVGRLVVATTAKVSGKILTIEDQQRLAEETNKQIAA